MNQQYILNLRALRDRVLADLDNARKVVAALEGEYNGYLRALAVIEGQPSPIVEPSEPKNNAPSGITERKARGAVKDIVLAIIAENSESGVRTSDVVDFAATKNVSLDRNSVASLLSRLAREGTLIYDRETRRYRPTPRPTGPVLRTVA
jgi:hypothetical protein